MKSIRKPEIVVAGGRPDSARRWSLLAAGAMCCLLQAAVSQGGRGYVGSLEDKHRVLFSGPEEIRFLLLEEYLQSVRRTGGGGPLQPNEDWANSWSAFIPVTAEALLDTMQSPRVRLRAGDVLWEVGRQKSKFGLLREREAAAALLAPRLTELDDPEMFDRATWTLGRDAPSRQALVTLLRTATDPNWVVRKASARGLGRIGDPVAVELLEELLEYDHQEDVRAAALEALLAIHPDRPDAADLLIAGLKDGVWSACFAAPELSRRNVRRALPLLQSLVTVPGKADCAQGAINGLQMRQAAGSEGSTER